MALQHMLQNSSECVMQPAYSVRKCSVCDDFEEGFAIICPNSANPVAFSQIHFRYGS